ncbi:hypothetical protein TNCV_4311181 [Trichonephila clavipes]|nr:hypothetical protein TNCV_4311181 [Trichonephila clavipes]
MEVTGNKMGSISHVQNTHDFVVGDNVMSKDEILPKHEKVGFIRRWFQTTCLCLSKKQKIDGDNMMGLPNNGFENDYRRY